MIISLLMYGTIVGLLAAVAARALEVVARAANAATRWTWIGAMALTIGLVGWAAATRPAASARVDSGGSIELPLAVRGANPAVGMFASTLSAARGVFGRIVDAGSASVVHVMPRQTGPVLLGLWLAITAALFGVLVAVEARGRRRTEAMPEERLHGLAVRVSTSTGPAVIGLAPPRIIVPGWLLARSGDEQRAALAHEQSHVRARDPWFLLGACAAVALMPWNVALWYMLSRIRLAVEVDCDARVLRAGVAARAYGELLISVAEHASTHRVGALALSGGPSHLHQRIQVMTAPVRRLSITRIAAACAVAGIAVLAACETQLPTQAEISNMDAVSATAAASKFGFATDSITRFFVNERETTAAAAQALPADSVASIEIAHENGRKGNDLRLTTLAARREQQIVKHEAELAAIAPGVPLLVRGDASTFHGLIFVDGVRTDTKALAGIKATAIASVQVLKGAAAMKESNDPAAAYGIIKITMRK